MKLSLLLAGLPVLALAATRPTPCKPTSPPPSEAETMARHEKFVNAFIVKPNITEAFEYINESYINHNPMAKNGHASAWGILSPIWESQKFTMLGTAFKGNMGWVNYRSSFGNVVDRFRWEAGCIAEHWDAGETMPSA